MSSNWNDWRELKYRIADFLFARELDDAYALGLKYGAEFATRRISFAVSLKSDSSLMTKTQRIGYDKAVQIVQDTKRVVEQETGSRR